jgi:hypothetical protein
MRETARLMEVPMLREERVPIIRSDEAPPHYGRSQTLESVVRRMSRGDWVSVTPARAKAMQRIVKRLGGNSTAYKTSEAFSCFKVLDAPWLEVIK